MKNKKIKKIKFLGSLFVVGVFLLVDMTSVMAMTFSGSGDDFVNEDVERLIDFEEGKLESGGSSLLDDILDDVEERYGFDEDVLRKAKRKGGAPTVELSFDNTNPKFGEKVTASVVAAEFRNNADNLYYTWFLVKENEQGKMLDTDGDGSLADEIENGKRRAMQIVARGSYDPNLMYESSDSLLNQVYAGNGDEDGDGEYKAPYGGRDGVGARSIGDEYHKMWERYLFVGSKEKVDSSKISRCYRHNYGAQFNYPLVSSFSGQDVVVKCRHQFAQPSDDMSGIVKVDNFSETWKCGKYETGDGKFTTGEERCWGTEPDNPDTDGDGVKDELDLVGLNQRQITWHYQKGDRIGVVVEGTSSLTINESNNSGYYKIMWAGLGICSKRDDDLSFAPNDECDEKASEMTEEYIAKGGMDDTGFSYLKTVSVNDRGKKLPKVELTYSPKSPNVVMKDDLESDLINVTASLSGESDLNSKYLYYEWKLEFCSTANFENCIKVDLSEESDQVEVLGHSQGMGVQDFSFRPKSGLLINGGNKGYFRPIVLLREDKSSVKKEVGQTLISLGRNNIQIKFYQLTGGDGNWNKGGEICTTGLGKELCPVYPFQMIAAEAVVLDGVDPESYIWRVGNQIIPPPRECIFGGSVCRGSEESTGFGKMVYFPVMGTEKGVGKISVSIERPGVTEGGEDLTAERIFSVNNPLVLVKPVSDNLLPATKGDSSESDKIFNTPYKSRVKFEAEVIPDYMEIVDWSVESLSPNQVYVTWYLNGEKVDDDFIARNGITNISLGVNSIEFNIIGGIGSGTKVTARAEKKFSLDHKSALKGAWEINKSHTLINDEMVMVKVVRGESPLATTSLKQFFASTAHNAPYYLIFSIRLALSLILIGSVLFGLANRLGLTKEEA